MPERDDHISDELSQELDDRDIDVTRRNVEGSQRVIRQGIIRLENAPALVCCERAMFVSGELMRAAGEQDVGCALGEHQHTPVRFGIRVDGGHQLALGGKGHLADA